MDRSRAVQVVPVSEWEGLSFPEGDDGGSLDGTHVF